MRHFITWVHRMKKGNINFFIFIRQFCYANGDGGGEVDGLRGQ